ncbi:MOSC domain-containing protein [Sulfurimonas lithotrophica]|uniref:MOSC domain-containing protein n=1 Tax=Sulfurimonas lithotrophica TaxID=2590022 RepID=A0A5P8NXU8_9BACT|nr:MOSC domain-containing protein [Sulfurimonas lithotrophica]QFR48261.1 MOSC domain-containing protein [Sulfurimonas lithotrophica]
MTEGNILELFISVKGQDNRKSKRLITLDEKGVYEDKFYGKNVQRSVLITSVSSYELALKNGINAPYSSLGENILIDINPYHLTPGDKIEIGEVILEITHNCTICNSLSKVDSALPKLLENDRGIFAKTIKSGNIKIGDKVKFLK